MNNANRGRSKIFIWIAIVVVLLIILGLCSDLIVKWLWMDSVGYEHVFWTIKGTQFLLFFCALIAALIYVSVNVYYLTKNIGPLHLNLGRTPTGDMNIINLKPGRIKTVLYTAGAFLSFFFALTFFFEWNEFIRFSGAQPFGIVDPLFGNDVSFYMLRLPFIETIQSSFIFLMFLVTAFLIIYNLAAGKINIGGAQHGSFIDIDRQPRRQIFTNIGLWLLLLAWGYFLERYQLLYEGHDLIFGAGYTQTHIELPLLWMMAIGCLLLALLAFLQTYQYKIRWFIRSAIGLIVIGIVGLALLPPAIQSFMVEPNELNLEKPYIKDNIKYTQLAYNLDKIKTENYNASDTLTYAEVREDQSTIQNIRLWDQSLIIDTYSQLQEIRLYYKFYNVDLDRYHTSKGYRQVLISARELETKLPPQAQTWVNSHLQYTHGYGLVMSPSAKKNSQGSPLFYLKNIPPESSIGMNIKQPAIYYGENRSNYKLVNTQIKELNYPKGDKNVYTHYKGNGGMSINGFLEQLLFAWHFGDVNLLLTDYIRAESKIQIWTAVQKRIQEIAPFLLMKDDPYMVVSEEKLYWIQDAYTIGRNFPYAEPHEDGYNYIRNSVKVVVDAYQGTVRFYISNPDDPVLKVYRQLFPEMFHPLSQMPGNLKQHVKYPKYLFRVQLKMFSTYHMNDPQVFYNKEDLWRRPFESYGGKTIRMRPYYILSSLPGNEKLQYLLISPMTPKSRDNMIAWVVVQSDFPSYGQITVYELSKERLFLGPAQIEAKIDQNTKISRQLSLWDQRGSRVIRGNLMVIPIEHSFLYVEPVFLIAQGVNIPQLKRVIVSTGSRMVMEPTLDQAISSLYEVETNGQAVSVINQMNPEEIRKKIPVTSAQFKKLQKLWGELQTALQNKNWETFGQKMEAINDLLGNE